MLRQDYQSTMDLRASFEEDKTRKPFLPVLIIPGFMSSGLEIRESSLKKSWEGKRLWINLGSLGFQAFHFGGAVKNNKEEDNDSKEHKQYKSLWIQHITLLEDMQTEYPGVKVRNIDGLAGVDYLSPGALTSMVSYVFGPVIGALLKVGYQDGMNLDAAPYDWRLAPRMMEKRDTYFTRTMAQIEHMYTANGNTPIVLLCHSLGCKVGHYLLNFAKSRAGQQWIDKHIHTYMPVGGPHLGAPKAIRSAISGDKMGLEAFLKDEEALVFGRSLGSGPWLMPTALPSGACSTAFVRQQGSLRMEVVGSISVAKLLEGRKARQRPDKVKLMIKFGNKTLVSRFVTVDRSSRVSFEEKFAFATDPNRIMYKGSNQLLVFLCEPGIAAAHADERGTNGNCKGGRCFLCCLKMFVCYCLWCCCFKVVWWLGLGLAKGTLKTADALAKASGGSTVLGLSRQIQLTARSSVVEVELHHRNDANLRVVVVGSRAARCRLRVRWEPWNPTPGHQLVRCSPIGEMSQDASMVSVVNDSDYNYKAVSGKDLIERELLASVPQAIVEFYDHDELGPRGTDAPPVQRIKAVYGINLPTEVGAVYKRRKGFLESDNTVHHHFTLDLSAKISKDNGYVCSGGIVFETKDTVNKELSEDKIMKRKASGDGTVPLWSLQHSKTWDTADCKVTTDEIDGASHREILADERFHKILLDYITTKTGNDQNV